MSLCELNYHFFSPWTETNSETTEDTGSWCDAGYCNHCSYPGSKMLFLETVVPLYSQGGQKDAALTYVHLEESAVTLQTQPKESADHRKQLEGTLKCIEGHSCLSALEVVMKAWPHLGPSATWNAPHLGRPWSLDSFRK